MKANFRKAVSFVLALILCGTCSVGFAAAADPQESMTGVQERTGTGIESVTSIEIRGDMLYVQGTLLDGGSEVSATLNLPEGDFLDSFDGSAYPDSVAGKTFELYFNLGALMLVDGAGTYSVCLGETGTTNLSPDNLFVEGYKVTFDVKDSQVSVEDPANPPWEDVHEDYEISVTPGALSLPAMVYKQAVSDSAVVLKNTGWEELTNVIAEVSGGGLTVSPDSAVSLLQSGEAQEYAVAPDTTVTPGSYHVSVEFSSTGDGAASNPAFSLPVNFTILKATRAALENVETAAAATAGGMGKITGLTPSAMYELAEWDADAPAEDADLSWTAFEAVDDGTGAGVYEVTPGSYKLRLPETDFYEAGESGEPVLVPGYYHFTDAVIEDMKAGVGTNYPVNELVTGGIGEKTFTLTAGTLPNGLRLSSDGYLTGTALEVTDSSFTLSIQVKDENPLEAARTLTGTVTIAGIQKGGQEPPEAMSLSISDNSITITNWQTAQEYAAATDSAVTAAGLDWKSWEAGAAGAGILGGLQPNKTYYVFTRLMETERLNPSPMVTDAALTLRTTVSAVGISGSGIVGKPLEAVVSPAAATVAYSWKNDQGTEIGTDPTLTVTEDLAGHEIKLEIKGTGDYQGTLVTEPWVVGGVTISVAVHSYDPGKAVTAFLTNADETLTFAAVSTTRSAVGRADQAVTLSAVNPNQTYKLVLKKAGHTDLVINGIAVTDQDLSITAAGALSQLRLYCGDFNGDNAVRLEDRATLLQSRFFGRAVSAFTGEDAAFAAMLDVDGDGYVKLSDLAIVMSSENYGRDAVTVTYK